MLTKTKKIALVATSAAAALLVSTSGAIAATSAAGVAQLPVSVKKNGYITVGVDATYRPNEFKNAKGNPIGWEVELINAVAADLGIKVRYVVQLLIQSCQQSRVASTTLVFHLSQIPKSVKFRLISQITSRRVPNGRPKRARP